MEKISVIGMGSWGTTLAILLSEKGNYVKGWEWIASRAKEMQRSRINSFFLPDCLFPRRLSISNNLIETVKYGELIVLAVPSHIVRNICSQIKRNLNDKSIVNVAKGLETETFMRMSEVIHDETGLPYKRIVTLSGPTHSEEVSKKLPAAIVAASIDRNFAQEIQDIFRTNYFRVYTSNDIKGVELGGSIKNVIAIGAGISDGMHFGDNAKAALITRGIREISRLGVACGANPHTFSGISGIGDLIVTCGSKYSRNRYVGEQLARGKTLKQIINNMEMIAEGIKTTEAVYHLSKKINIEMPITSEIYKILFENEKPREGLESLMNRTPKSEDEF